MNSCIGSGAAVELQRLTRDQLLNRSPSVLLSQDHAWRETEQRL
jgi:hypothetical protein